MFRPRYGYNARTGWRTPAEKLFDVESTFTRTGVAYDRNGDSIAANTPRFGMFGEEEGLLIEEATTNLVTANQSTGTDTLNDTTGFQPSRDGILTSTTEQQYIGDRSLKVTTPGTQTYEGVGFQGSDTNETYTLSFMVYCPVTAANTMEITISRNGMGTIRYTFTGIGGWDKIVTSFNINEGTGNFTVYIRTKTTQDITFYLDMIQIEEKPYPTNWQLGGTTRNTEGIILPSTVLNKAEGTIECEIYTNPAFITGEGNIFGIGTTNLNNQIGAYYTPTNKITGVTSDNNGDATLTTSDNTFTPNTWVSVALTWKNTGNKVYVTGTATTSTGTVNLPSELANNLFLLANYNGEGIGNTLIRTVCISKIQRTYAEIQSRITNNYPLDKYVTAKGVLEADLIFKGMARV